MTSFSDVLWLDLCAKMLGGVGKLAAYPSITELPVLRIGFSNNPSALRELSVPYEQEPQPAARGR